ncbi:YpoC family protein [Bacillus sp. 2205SS5-2]|uniref:YpoC family protein n=1 Tax=Bacillus sp. 2205SS5-2 TaxID=3109031 RepID=UPI0030073169
MECNIPSQLIHPLFFQASCSVEQNIGRNSNWIHELFPFEIMYYTNEKSDEPFPWQNPENYLKEIFSEWECIQNKLNSLFAERSNELDVKMKKGVSLLFKLLFWSNDKPVSLDSWQKSILEYSYKPVNVIERLDFVIARPVAYPSFIQLNELMNEQYKQGMKKIAIKKRRPPA